MYIFLEVATVTCAFLQNLSSRISAPVRLRFLGERHEMKFIVNELQESVGMVSTCKFSFKRWHFIGLYPIINVLIHSRPDKRAIYVLERLFANGLTTGHNLLGLNEPYGIAHRMLRHELNERVGEYAASANELVLELRKSLYGVKQAGRLWSRLLQA